MSTVGITLPHNLTAESITGLSNTSFDPGNNVPDRGATEGQLAALNTALVNAMEQMDDIINSDDGMLQNIWDRLQTLQDQIEECCSTDHGGGALDTVWPRLEALETQMAECANPSHGAAGDGTPIFVLFGWNGDGSDPVTDGGQATATSSDANRTIIEYWFLSRDANTGLYYRASAVYGGDYSWRIDMTTGAVTAVEANGAVVPYSSVIVAVDDMGNEGAVSVNLPIEINVVGG